jgi:hypothetical protein
MRVHARPCASMRVHARPCARSSAGLKDARLLGVARIAGLDFLNLFLDSIYLDFLSQIKTLFSEFHARFSDGAQ